SMREGSGWVIDEILKLRLVTSEYSPLAGSSYIHLDKYLSSKKALINIQNDDQKCFLWSVLAYLHPAGKNSNRVEKYKQFESRLNLNGIEWPMKLNDVPKFERQNDISISIYGYEEGYYDKESRRNVKEVFPIRISNEMRQQHIQLLLVSDDTKQHYVLIKNFNRLLSDRTKTHIASHYCTYCLHRSSSEECLTRHRSFCTAFDAQRANLPEEGQNTLKFNKHNML